MAEDLPSKWYIGSEAYDNERLDLAPQYAYFRWDDDRSVRYSGQELKEKIEAEGRTGDDPYVKAYKQLADRA